MFLLASLAWLVQVEPPAAAPVGSSLHWIDLVGLGLLGLFGLLGAFRGLWWQVIRLLGLAAAVAVARALAPRFGPSFQRASELPEPVANGIVWLLLFLGVLLAASLLGTVGKRTLEAVRLGPVDRFGGLVAGLLTALVLHAAFLVALSYLGPTVWASESLQQAESRKLLQSVTTQLHLYVGEDDAERIRQWFDEDGEPVQLAPADGTVPLEQDPDELHFVPEALEPNSVVDPVPPSSSDRVVR